MNNRLKVLIVEDEALPAMLLRGYLEDAGHEVVGWATSSTEAIELVRVERPDLTFVDLHLADGLTGVNIAKDVCAAHSHVVFITANSRMLPADYAGALGAISKPYSVHGIQRALKYIEEALRSPPPRCTRPSSFTLAPRLLHQWS
jgi:two-component system, response regulator PdtaR